MTTLAYLRIVQLMEGGKPPASTYTSTKELPHEHTSHHMLALQCPDACESIATTPVDVYERSVAYVWYLGSDLSTTAEEWLAG